MVGMIDPAGAPPLLGEDVETIAAVPESTWERLRGSRILLTGGTGYVGTWLVAALAWANRTKGLDATALIVSRKPEEFLAREPWVTRQSWVRFVQGDARELSIAGGDFTHGILGAAAADAKVTREQPLSALETIVTGTARALRGLRPTTRVLLLSSGAVYGDDGLRPDLVDEEFRGTLDWLAPAHAYHVAKRAAEAALLAAGTESGVRGVIARLFAFHGPWLPTDRHFAVGNFVRDALAGHDIVVHGDGSPVRSYLYAADMTVWLLSLLAEGKPGRAYNVGSDRALSVAELAHLVAEAMPSRPSVRILGAPGRGGGGQRYVPDVSRAREELGLRETVPLKEGLRRTVRWLQATEERT